MQLTLRETCRDWSSERFILWWTSNKQEQVKRTKSQTERVRVFESHSLPLYSIDLKDVFNFDEFIQQFADEEQKKLQKLLPRSDSDSLPDSHKMMFESDQFKENFSLW